MRYKLLGRSGLRVSELALGTMTFGEAWGWGASKDECRRIFDAFVEAGGNFVDTACNYTDGESEEILGELVQADRERLVLATKYTLTARRDDPNAGGNHRKNLVQTLEGSLRRLRTDYVDLLWLHMWDGLTPVDEVVRALDDLVTAGKVLYVGHLGHALLGRVPGGHARRPPRLVALRRGAGAVLARRPRRRARAAADGAVARARVHAVGDARGRRAHREVPADATTDEPRRYGGAGERVNGIAREVLAVAEELGATPSQVAIAWVRAQPWLTIPIVGARTEAQLRENLGALEVELPDEAVERLSAAERLRRRLPALVPRVGPRPRADLRRHVRPDRRPPAAVAGETDEAAV